MTTRSDTIDLAGIRFFGKMSASLTHDIKNGLAVINENAGLLEDLCLMADRGKLVDLARLRRIAGDVQAQVKRADRIVSAMNRFAHSADEPSVETDLGEMTGLLGLLTMRLASMRGVVVLTPAPIAPVLVNTFPFGLLDLLWECLDCAMTAAGPGRSIELMVEETADGGSVRFGGIEQARAASTADIAVGRLSSLLHWMNASLAADDTDTELVVRLPGVRRVQERADTSIFFREGLHG